MLQKLLFLHKNQYMSYTCQKTIVITIVLQYFSISQAFYKYQNWCWQGAIKLSLSIKTGISKGAITVKN